MVHYARVEEQNQEDLKLKIKLWLKANNRSYAWLAEHCYVTEATVRNWMSRRAIPDAKAHIIRGLIKEVPLTMPNRVEVKAETVLTLKLDTETRRRLERRAFAMGLTLEEFLSQEVPRLGDPGNG